MEQSRLESWGPFLESSETFLHPESLGKVLNLMITELPHSRTLNMNRGYLQTRSLRHTCPAAFKYRLTINDLLAPEVPKTFQAYFANSCTVQGNVQAFRLTGLLWWQNLSWLTPAFSLTLVDFTVQFCFRCKFSIHFTISDRSIQVTVAWFS